MSRCLSPLHVHVGRKTPIHVHLKSRPKTKTSPVRQSERKRLDQSFAEMAAGRPSLRAMTGTSRSSRMKPSDWARASSSRGPWIPPPAKSTKPSMSWEGPTHRLEINPPDSEDVRNGTVLRMSDLTADSMESTEIVVEQEEGRGYEETVDALMSEVGALKAEVDLQKSLRSLEVKEAELRESKASLREKEAELKTFREELLDSEREKLKLKSSVSRIREDTRAASELAGSQRERLLKKMVEVEMDSNAAAKQADRLREAVRKLQKDRHFSTSVHASDVTEQKDLLLERLQEFETSNKSLGKLLRSQQSHEASAKHLADQRELLLQRLSESDATNHLLRSQLQEKEQLAMHTQVLHDEIGDRDAEIQSLRVRLQSVEEQLHQRDSECEALEGNLRKTQRDKEALKRATRQHKDRAAQGEAEIYQLTARVRELEESLAQTNLTNKSSLEALSARLTEKTHELNTTQLNSDRLQVTVNTLGGKLKVVENTSHTKVSTLECEVAQLQASVDQYESLSGEYKAQLDKSRRECDTLTRELRRKDQEVERLQQEHTLQMERSRLKLQQQITELEAMPEMLKTAEIRLKDTQERLATYEQRAVDQTRTIAELTAKAEQRSEVADDLRGKWHEATAENNILCAKLDTIEKRVQEADQQNRELISIAGKKEEAIQKFQKRIEGLLQEVSSLSTQLETTQSDSRRHAEHLKDRAASKERASLSRITDLESQLSRANGLSTHLRKSKDESDRRYQSRLHELQDKLDQANSTKRSMENYVNFLKSSYASVFNDSGNPASPLSPLLH